MEREGRVAAHAREPGSAADGANDARVAARDGRVGATGARAGAGEHAVEADPIRVEPRGS